jgi:hypothetical protein
MTMSPSHSHRFPPTRLWSHFASSCLLLATLATIPAEEQTPANGDDWLTFYYRNPRPDQLVPQLKAWSAEGTLQDKQARAPLVGFLSQVFRLNAARIEEWYSQVKDLPAEDLETVSMALWMSNTKEGKQLLHKEHPGVFDENPPPDILKLKLDTASTLDLLWGYYFATGDSQALRRIVSMFNYADAPDKVKGVPDDRSPLYKTLPDAAKWSLSSNASQHPKVLADCKKMLTDGQLNATEKEWLDKTLQQAAEE